MEEESAVPLYAVVSFVESSSGSQLDIDLVPWQWLIELEDTKWFCFYPPEKDYHHRDEWLASLKKADLHWECYAVNVISTSRDLKQGRRRLKRAYRSTFVDTMDTESTPVQKSAVAKPFLTQIGQFKDFATSSQSKVTNRNCSIMEVTEETAAPKELNDISEGMKAYFDTKFAELHLHVQKEIASAKRSILYDLDNKINTIKTLISDLKPMIPAINGNSTECRETLGTALPIKSHDEFLAFEQMLRDHHEKKDALRALYRILICGEARVSHSIAKIMTATLTKAVETAYSGTGRKIHGKGKENFSLTETFACLQHVISEKFRDSEEAKNLPGKVGRWLSGTADREGGRKERGCGQPGPQRGLSGDLC